MRCRLVPRHLGNRGQDKLAASVPPSVTFGLEIPFLQVTINHTAVSHFVQTDKGVFKDSPSLEAEAWTVMLSISISIRGLSPDK
jgi:hypothetical protein